MSYYLLLALAVALTLLQIFDGWTTYQIVKRGGVEKNSLVGSLIDDIGLYPALLLLKAVAAGLCWLLALMPGDFTQGVRLALLVALATFYLWVAFNNWNVYRNLG